MGNNPQELPAPASAIEKLDEKTEGLILHLRGMCYSTETFRDEIEAHAALRKRIRELEQEIKDAKTQLWGAIDRDRGNETLHSLCIIAANAIYWRDIDIKALKVSNDALISECAQLRERVLTDDEQAWLLGYLDSQFGSSGTSSTIRAKLRSELERLEANARIDI